MVDRKAVWALAAAASAAISQHLSPAVQAAIQEGSFKDVPNWFVLGTAFYVRPEPLTVERMRVRNPYADRKAQEEQLREVAEAGFLDDKGVITQAAVDAYQALIDVQDAEADKLDYMADEELEPVVAYLRGIYEAALKVSEPPIPCLKDATRLDMRGDTLHQVFYTIGRLFAFRDDCHLAAWKHLELDGHTYEALSLVWDGTGDCAAKLLEARPNRGYDEAGWQTALDRLVEMGWLQRAGDTYQVTSEGQKIRDEIEAKTEEYSCQIFDSLREEELDEMASLLKTVQEKFTPEAEAQT